MVQPSSTEPQDRNKINKISASNEEEAVPPNGDNEDIEVYDVLADDRGTRTVSPFRAHGGQISDT